MVYRETEYFRSAIIAKNQGVLNFKNNDSGFEVISKDEFYEGKLKEKVLKKLLAKKANREKLIKVIIVAKTIKNTIKDGKKNNSNIDELTGIFYVPALMSVYDGTLSINKSENKWPWIPREFLAPMLEPELCLGKVNEIDSFLENTTDIRFKIDHWSSYIAYVEDFYNQITKADFKSNIVKINNMEIELEENIYIILDNTVNPSYNVEMLYDDILKNNEEKPLYKRFMSISKAVEEPLISNYSYKKMIDHKGQMGGAYSLASSQREAINHFLEINDGEILAVSGPPGTGKTTLLQSIVANLYVEKALKEEKAPIIVASSTNNQAVTNIIDSFGSIKPIGISNLEERWIEGVNSFAVYFPSAGKKKSAIMDGYHITSNQGDGFAKEIDSTDNLAKSQKRMLKSVEKYFNVEFKNIRECKILIHNTLIDIESKKTKVIEVLQSIKEVINNETLSNYIDKLDKQILECLNKINWIELEKQKIKKEIEDDRIRVERWHKIYNKIPWFLKLLKNVSVVKKKISKKLNMYRDIEKEEFLPQNLSIDIIVDIYREVINCKNAGIIRLNSEEKIEQNNIAKINKEKKVLSEKQKAVREIFIELKKYNCNIWDKCTKADKDLADCVLDKLNDYIDTKVRYVEFWLAVHYYECRWLEKESWISDKQRGKNYKNVIEDLYHRISMVTPCMVMTFYMLPKNFNIFNYNEKLHTYLYNYIDLLIVDEAGQVSPEVAAPSFALAKKAIIVGDENQIPPVWGVQKALDIAMAIENKVIYKPEEFEKIISSGHNCSESSVMKIAINSCKYNKYGSGLFLSEHRRCYDEIISYCNELVYQGKLEPCRGKGKKDVKYTLKKYPHMAYKNIEVTNSEKNGCSRVNTQEAVEIAKWLSKHYHDLIDSYKGVNENQVIAVITPFRGQVLAIKKQLKIYLQDKAKNIDVGTVHTFQGAERKIIILSTVYGSNDGCYFINQNNSLMNVAVSRAKDAFWIFGSRECLDKTGDSASALLRKYVNEEIS